MYEKLRRHGESTWARWADDLANGRGMPKPLELLEVGAILGIREPGAELEAEANALREVRELERQAADLKARAAAQRAPHGDTAQRRERITALKAEIRRLEALAGPLPVQIQAGNLLGEASRIRRKFPRVFRPKPADTGAKPADTGAKPAARSTRTRKEPVA